MDYLENKLAKVAASLNVNLESKKELEHFYKIKPKDGPVKKKVVTRKFTPRGNSIYLIPLADSHIGHTASNLEMFYNYCQLINSYDDCYTILLGDQMETATKQSIGMAMFEEEIHVPQQMEALHKILKPLADNNKILGMIPGNHELRIAQLTGMNITEHLCNLLNVEYLGYQGFLNLKVGDQSYDIMVHHGVGGGSTSGAKVNSVERLGRVAVCDAYLMGHTHIKHFTEDYIHEIRDGQLISRRRYYITCGSFLNYWGGYPEINRLVPSVPGGVCIELRGDSKNIHVNI
jgi:hypothetical protein